MQYIDFKFLTKISEGLCRPKYDQDPQENHTDDEKWLSIGGCGKCEHDGLGDKENSSHFVDHKDNKNVSGSDFFFTCQPTCKSN